MRVAVISDTHFGDPLSTLATTSEREAVPSIGPAYEPLVQAVGKVDYLVLLGDIIDFSVASYADAYRDARCFFRRLEDDGVAREIIYVRGNHDCDVWHTVDETGRGIRSVSIRTEDLYPVSLIRFQASPASAPRDAL